MGSRGHPCQKEGDGPSLEGGSCPQAVAEMLKLGKSPKRPEARALPAWKVPVAAPEEVSSHHSVPEQQDTGRGQVSRTP